MVLATFLIAVPAFATILKTVPAFATILEAVPAFATILKAVPAFKAFAALLTLLAPAFEALAVAEAISALVKARTVPAVHVEAERDLFDRVHPVKSQRDCPAHRDCLRAIG
jgi:hypothetical protein